MIICTTSSACALCASANLEAFLMPSLELVISFSISARHSATQAAMAGGRVGAAVALRAESVHRTAGAS